MTKEKIEQLNLLLNELSLDADVKEDEDFSYNLSKFRDELKEQMYILKDIDLY